MGPELRRGEHGTRRLHRHTSGGGYVPLGHTASCGSGVFNLWTLKLTSEGEVAWEKVYPTANPMNPASIKQIPRGRVRRLRLDPEETGGPAQAWVARLDSEGSILWQRTHGDPSMRASLHHMSDTADGGLVGTGYLYLDAVGAFVNKVWVIKWDAAGEADWQNTYWSACNGFGRDVRETGDGG